MELGVILDAEGRTASHKDGAFVNIYAYLGHWRVQRTLLLRSDKIASPLEKDDRLFNLMNYLKECKILVVKSMEKEDIALLESNGFGVWEIDGKPEEFLDYIYKSAKQDKQKENLRRKAVYPIEEKPGYYTINLKDIMNDKNSLSSKQVLLPFFKKGEFTQLFIECEHVPRWFEQELPKLKLKAKVIEDGKEIQVIVTKFIKGE